MRGCLGIILALLMAGCGMFADRPRPAAAPPALASAADQPAAAATAGQYAGVEVSWEDRADLQSPAREASMLSDAIMAELQKRDMSHRQAEQSLRVRIMEVLLRPGGRMQTASSVLNARVYVLAADGSEAMEFPPAYLADGYRQKLADRRTATGSAVSALCATACRQFATAISELICSMRTCIDMNNGNNGLV